MPPIPTISKQQAEPESEPEANDDDPFGDQNGKLCERQAMVNADLGVAIRTPLAEKTEPTWRDV